MLKKADMHQRNQIPNTLGPRFARGQKNTKGTQSGSTQKVSVVATVGRGSVKLFGRGLKVILGGLVLVGVVVVLLAGLVAGYLYVSSSDYFSVKRVTITGINQISRDEILAITGLNQPVNILTFDPVVAKNDLSFLPWLAEVNVSRHMPDAVTIDVVEHRPKLLVSLGRLYYLSEDGEPFKELEAGENPGLPVLSGFGEDELLNAGSSVKRALGEVFWLVDTLKTRNDEFRLDNISEINYDMVRGFTLFTKNNAVEVKIGFGTYEEKFRRLGRVLAHLKLRGKYEGLVYLNLEASPRVTVRYNGSGDQPGSG